MERALNFSSASAWVVFLSLGVSAFAAQTPAGTHLEVRLTTKVSSVTAMVKDPVEAVLTAPVWLAGEFVLPAGAKLRGEVEKVANSAKAEERSSLALAFMEIEIEGTKHKIAARVAEVDNARETVDEAGMINGILAAETISGRIDSGIAKLNEKASGLAGILATVKKAVLTAAESDITYDAGTDLRLVLTAPLDLKSATGPGPVIAKLVPIANEDALYEFVNRQPFQTFAEKPPKESDITNLMLVGTQEQITQAFHDAGWASAAELSNDSKFETFKAIASQRGYKEAPVSLLLLEKKAPDMVFEKLTNTFAERHHLRVWRRPDSFDGKPAWVVAATHDTGIEFSEQNRTFIHKIDSEIDRERAKVVNDLLFTGRVRSVALVERSGVPKSTQNATGDNVTTDASMAVLIFN
jgi:hypothetical protein